MFLASQLIGLINWINWSVITEVSLQTLLCFNRMIRNLSIGPVMHTFVQIQTLVRIYLVDYIS